jgi:hypothetical protein
MKLSKTDAGQPLGLDLFLVVMKPKLDRNGHPVATLQVVRRSISEVQET